MDRKDMVVTIIDNGKLEDLRCVLEDAGLQVRMNRMVSNCPEDRDKFVVRICR